ncbi:unnamed protein product [Allacma fusca]|uniref:CRAL-TRIO domain-containing protein n=1 Tax=Allacma fusca TaxID=39272 RepID=A0A8J2LE00_9HEXA|nr:unnamed protein product [Allacma fusca]
MSNLMAYFPSVAETVIFYNMNNIFKVILNTIKPFLTSPFLHMEVLGPNEKIWRERILGIMKLEDFEKCEQAWE